MVKVVRDKVFLKFVFLLIGAACIGSGAKGQNSERWRLSVNNNRSPLEMMMDIGADVKTVTYLFDITRDTLNMSLVAEEDLDFKKHRVSVFAMPKNREVLRLRLEDEDLSDVKVVFLKMWNAMPKNFKNVLTLFELREIGITQEGAHINNNIIRFKMKPPRRRRSVEL
ncbi:MAG: hypothetical protein ACEPOZ_01470 [Marinifilaceae bacterium]